MLKLLAPLVTACLVAPTLAQDIFVDGYAGDDRNSGLQVSPTPGDGPVRTIKRAMRLVGAGGTIHLNPTGEPYYESISLVGVERSGYAGRKFTVDGHGAELSGARAVPPESWIYVGNGLFYFRPYRKGWYQLTSNQAVLPEQVLKAVPKPDDLERGHWGAYHGTIYFRTPSVAEHPTTLAIGFAYDQVGISCVDVEDVVIRNLTVKYFRQDGINIHDRCNRVVLENVKLLDNGRAGLAVGGYTGTGATGCEFGGNREAQVLVTERAFVEIIDSKFGDTRGVKFRRSSGRLIIDGQEAE